MSTTFEDMFAGEDVEASPPTEITDAATLHMLRTMDENRSLVKRLDDDNREISDYLAEHYSGQRRLVWVDSQGHRRQFRVTGPTVSFEPGVQGLNWLEANHPSLHRIVTKRVLDTKGYDKLRRLGVITDEMHETMLPRDDDGNPIPARTRRATVTLPAVKVQESNDASS